MLFKDFIDIITSKAKAEAKTSIDCFGKFADIRLRCLGIQTRRDLLEAADDHYRSGNTDELQFNVALDSVNKNFRIGLALSYDGFPNARNNVGSKTPPVWDRFKKTKKIFPPNGIKTIHLGNGIPQDGFHELSPQDGGFQFWGRLVEWRENELDEFYQNLSDEMLNYLNDLVKIYIYVYCDDKWRELMYEEYISLLKSSKQIILTGAPGTGKTYTAKELAGQLIGTGSDLKEQMEFIQFHPSYDYTDFIEGLKPYKDPNNQLSFELKNGIFKNFCRKAGVIERIMFKLYEKEGKIDWSKFNSSNIAKELDNFCIPDFWRKWLDANKEQGADIIKALPKFVFIIDEINRAELSKVIGELMYSLEPDYRGIEGKVKTQYSEMNTNKTFFVNENDDWFFIPSNVYIIGTMNDIDRSIEIFDFALRRRFAWYEVKVDDVMETVLKGMLTGPNWSDDKINSLKKKAEELNKVITEQQWGFNEHYKIGPAYFGKIKNYLQDPSNDDLSKGFDSLWENHLQLLLFEYVRGTGKEREFINACKKIFVNPDTTTA